MIDWLKCFFGRHDLSCKSNMIDDDIVTVKIMCKRCSYRMLSMTKVTKPIPKISMLKE